MSSKLVVEREMAETLKLQVRRVIRAKRQRVFEAWTRPELIKQWFGPAQRYAPNASNDFRVGGEYHIEVRGKAPSGEKKVSNATGVYTKIVPNELLRFTWNGDWIPGEETLVTVEFRDVEGGTEVILTHERFTTVESQRGHEQGWNGCLEKLARFLEN